MTAPPHEQLRAEVLVIGSGAAGLSVALGLGSHQVLLLTDGRLGDGATLHAQGGIAAAVGPDDTGRLHAADTLAVGGGLSDPHVVELLTAEGPASLQRLLERGARFERTVGGRLATGREPGHRRSRIVHAGGASTGRELVRVLAGAVEAAPWVRVVQQVSVGHLAVDDHGRVCGAWGRDAAGRVVSCAAGSVVLATGGIGGLFDRTTNPARAVGRGLALAARTGACLTDLEFVQFHPTAFDVDTVPLPLLSEILRGEGAVIVDQDGERFLFDAHPDGELAPRDVVAQAVWRHRARGHDVLLDLRPVRQLTQRFPAIVGSCRRHELDPTERPVPVTPAAHYHMGGVVVDEHGRSSVPGLWACGEVACTGVHGANRLASNSLLEALVFGARVAHDLTAMTLPLPVADLRPAPGQTVAATAGTTDADAAARLRRLMWEHVGVVRDGAGLADAGRRLQGMAERCGSPLADQVTVARMVVAAALARRESRGAHQRSDHPRCDPAWQRRLVVRLDRAGEPCVARGARLDAAA
ncbi:MAG TPA: L-aspartate oxidase [Nitriliruptorales bacterium]|nr:L-aspartate oxidase [Nitriliruptorales bacterium]